MSPSAKRLCLAAVLVSAAAAHAASCGVQDGVFLHGDREAREIALTFDACPVPENPAFAADLVKYLREAQVPATFFVSGTWAQANREALRTLAEMQVPSIRIKYDAFGDT